MLQDNVISYLNKINKIPRVSKEEELYLIKEAQQGNKDARDKLIKTHLRFVYFTAKKYHSNNVELSDLINEGNIGLMEAVDKFKPNKNIQFLSFAVYYINRSILSTFEKENYLIRATTLEKEKSEYQTNSPNINFRNKIKILKNDIIISLDTDIMYSNYVIDHRENIENRIEKSVLPKIINKALDNLNKPQYKRIIEYRFGLNGHTPLSFRECGEIFDLSHERIRQIEEKVIKRLRHGKMKKQLKEFIQEPA
jgi:RNA polymerase primary sigma factor